MGGPVLEPPTPATADRNRGLLQARPADDTSAVYVKNYVVITTIRLRGYL